MQYLIQFQKNLSRQTRFLNFTLEFKDKTVESSYQIYQKQLNMDAQIFIEIFKVIFEFVLMISTILKMSSNNLAWVLIPFPIISLISLGINCKNQKCHDCIKIIQTILLQVYSELVPGIYFPKQLIFICTAYVTQSITNKKYLIFYFLITQVTYQCYENEIDVYINFTVWLLIIVISIAVFLRERKKMSNYFNRFNYSHDLSFQEAILNNSLRQNLFVIKMTSISQGVNQIIKQCNNFEVLFANYTCTSEFASIDEICQKTSQINIINSNDSNVQNYQDYNMKINISYEQCIHFKGSTNDQMGIIEKPFSLSQILTSYLQNNQNKEILSTLPLKLVGIYLPSNQTFDIIISPCIWRNQSSFIVSLIDQTDRLKISKLEQLDQYKDNVMANVSHDLKNPISQLQQSLTIVFDELKQISPQITQSNVQNKIQECCNYLEMCHTNIEILSSLVNDLQDFAQIKQQKLKLVVAQFQLQQLANEIQNVFNLQFQKKCLILDLQLNIKHSQIINNDSLRIKQVLFNLLSNALKFTEQGQVNVIITDENEIIQQFCTQVKEQIQNNKSKIDIDCLNRNKLNIVICSIEDSGVGINDEIQKNLFKNFSTYDNEKKCNKNGVGLGLLICKQLCGYIGPLQYVLLKSKQGVGSTFQFAIYKNYDKLGHSDLEQSSVDSLDYDISVHSPYKNAFSTHHLTPLSKYVRNKDFVKILVVDDEPFNVVLLKQLLIKNGLRRIEVAYNGQEAILKVKQNNFDIVFLDISMPGISGIDCASEIRKIDLAIKIFMLTSFNDNETIQACYSKGVDKIFQKPLSSEQLSLLFN